MGAGGGGMGAGGGGMGAAGGWMGAGGRSCQVMRSGRRSAVAGTGWADVRKELINCGLRFHKAVGTTSPNMLCRGTGPGAGAAILVGTASQLRAARTPAAWRGDTSSRLLLKEP